MSGIIKLTSRFGNGLFSLNWTNLRLRVSLPLFRQFLQGHQFPDYMKVPVYRGNEARRVADNLRDESLSLYLSARSTFVIVALLTGDLQAPTVEWVDINNAKLPQQLEAKALLEKA